MNELFLNVTQLPALKIFAPCTPFRPHTFTARFESGGYSCIHNNREYLKVGLEADRTTNYGVQRESFELFTDDKMFYVRAGYRDLPHGRSCMRHRAASTNDGW